MDYILYISWFFTGLSLLGAFVNSKGNLLASSLIWMVANIFWLCLDASRGLWAQSALYFAFIAMNILGIYTSIKRTDLT